MIEVRASNFRNLGVGLAKNRRNKQQKQRLPKSNPSVDFDLEENAQDIFLNYLAENEVPDKDQQIKSCIKEPKRSRKQRGKKSVVVDLHGLTVAEACSEVESRINSMRAPSLNVSLKIITGKGLHSGPGGGVLSLEVYSFVRDRFAAFIERIDDPPHNVKLSGVPIRGHFEVELKF